MRKFWNWIRDDNDGQRILRLEGPIDEDNVWGDEVTPKAFRTELESGEGDITVWINSPGGNIFAADQIYTMLKDYNGKVTVKIDAVAASAASVIAMAGDEVLMSPVAMLMLHDPSTVAMGNTKDMEAAIKVLNEVKESIINAYMAKSGLSHNKIAQLMSEETWISAKKAVQLGFADEILFKDEEAPQEDENAASEGNTETAENGSSEESDAGNTPRGGDPKTNDAAKEIHSIFNGAFSTKAMELRVVNSLCGRAAVNKATAAVTARTDTSVTEMKAEIGAEKGGAAHEKPVVNVVPKEPVKAAETADTAAVGKAPGITEEEIRMIAEAVVEALDARMSEREQSADSLGPDGKTADGSMPYALLQKTLDYLK